MNKLTNKKEGPGGGDAHLYFQNSGCRGQTGLQREYQDRHQNYRKILSQKKTKTKHKKIYYY